MACLDTVIRVYCSVGNFVVLSVSERMGLDVIIRFHETRLSTSSNHKRHIAINNSEPCLLCECDDVLISGISKKYFVQMVDIECRLSNWCMNHIHYSLYRCS